jgi:A/G-specific adenine glycosylase
MPEGANEDATKLDRLRGEVATHGCSERAVALFRQLICDYFRTHGRDLAWRRTRDPYRIFVSEIMLQQTQVPRVEARYPEFIAAFPDFGSLAAAPLRDVLAVWQGMGYNRRARALKESAERVVREFGGRLPEDESVLATFPGIGPATAASIAAFAFNRPVVFIETNIRRVFIHCFFADAEGVRDRDILPLVERTLPPDHPREWYWALMDYGSMLKTRIENPNRRSAAYRKQAPFEGSDRQLRGRILRLLLEEGEMGEAELTVPLSGERGRLKRILAGLEREGLVIRNGEKLRIG